MRRNKILIAGMLAMMTTMSVFGQKGITVKGGILLNNVSVSGIGDAFTPDKAFLTGYQIGAFYDMPVTSNLSFVPGIQWAEKGFMAQEGFNINVFKVPVELGLQAETRFRYLQAPLWMKYNWGEGNVKGYVTGGPTVGYAVDGEVQTKANFILDFNVSRHNLNLSNDLYNQFEVGAGIGAGVDFAVGNGSILFEATYHHSFTDILANPLLDVQVRNQGIGLSVGYRIPLH